MKRDKLTLMELYQALRKLYGYRGWWPGETTDEIIIGAILTQNVNWKNVEKAINNLKANDLLSFEQIQHCPTESIARLIIPTRYYNQKARRLKDFAEFMLTEYSFSFEQMFARETYTARLLDRLGFVSQKIDYDERVDFITRQIPQDVELYKDMHAQIVHFSATVCKAKPLCEGCVFAGCAGSIFHG